MLILLPIRDRVPELINHLLLLALSLFILSSCSDRPEKHTDSPGAILIRSFKPSYSKSFQIDYYQGFKTVKVFSGIRNNAAKVYLLCPHDMAMPAGYEQAIRIDYPVRHLVCMSTTHVGAMALLGAGNMIAATTNADLIYDTMVRSMIASGAIKNAGKDYQPDYEVIAQVKPDLLLSDGENAGASQMNSKLHAMGVKIVSSRDYYEQEPLARAEWLKFFAAFIDKENVADSIFSIVETRYNLESKKIARTAGVERPTVFCNLPYGGVWYMPCGANYVAKLITEAGGDFLWNDDKPMNGLNLTLNFEQVYQRAASADYWINTNTFTSLSQIEKMDSRFKLFKAYKEGHIYNGVKRLSPGGGMDIWETGSYRPDIVLHDLSLILYGHQPVENELYYYTRLK